ncbi:hypothetical protein A2U01_0050510, partial [Trifolium medium]|nr:hypothetical protein [Trifolium medium]
MCPNEYNMSQDKVTKTGGKFEVDREIALKDHPVGQCLPGGHQTEDGNYMGNQWGNPYPTNQNWNRYPNQTQGGAPQLRRPSPLEEMLTKFVGQNQTNFETIQGIVTNQ